MSVGTKKEVYAFLLIISIALNIVSLYATWECQKYAQWKEGDGYISMVYRYNLTFWRVFFPLVEHNKIFQGDYYISKTLAEAVNLTCGWWHVVSVGYTIIHIEKR